MPWSPTLTYQLLGIDGTTVVSTVFLVREGSARTQVALSGTGSGKIDVDPGDDTVGDLAAEFRHGRYIRVLHDAVPIQTWRIEGPSPEKDRDIVGGHLGVAGRGWGADWDVALVYPWRGVRQTPSPDYRIFSFASPILPSLVPGDWVGTDITQGKVSDPASVRRSIDAAGDSVPAPIGFPDPDAYWSWSSDSDETGRKYFRTIFTVPADGVVAIAMTGDNYWTGYLDGIPISGDTAKPDSWSEYVPVELFLEAGDYNLAAVVENLVEPPGNVGGWCYSVYTMTATGEVDTVLKRSDGITDIVTDVGVPEPGWTPGEILDTLLDEAQANGMLAGWSLSFDGDLDSAGDAWPVVPSFSCGIGESMLKVLSLLHDEGWIDYSFRAGSKILDMWNIGSGAASAVILRDEDTSITSDGIDIALDDVEFSRTDPAPNRILVRFALGYEVVNDTAGQLADGYVEEALMTVDTDLRVEAVRLAEHAMAAAREQVGSVSADIIPVDAPTTPFSGFGIRDLVQVPVGGGSVEARRTIALTVTDRGVEPEYFGEWAKRRRPREVKREELLQTLGSGVVGSAPGSRPRSASVNGGFTPSSVPVVKFPAVKAPTATQFPGGVGAGSGTGLMDHSWDWGGIVAPVGDVDSTLYPTPGFVELHEWEAVFLDVDAGGSNTVQFLVNEVLQSTIVVPTSTKRVIVSLADAVVSGDLSVRLLDNPTGAGVGLSATVRFTPTTGLM